VCLRVCLSVRRRISALLHVFPCNVGGVIGGICKLYSCCTLKQVCLWSRGKGATLLRLSLYASPTRRACSSNNSASSNLATAQWEFPTVKNPQCLQCGAPYFTQKLTLPVDRSPNPTVCLIHGPVRPTMPNSIRIRSAVFPQCTGQTHAHKHTHGHTMVRGNGL